MSNFSLPLSKLVRENLSIIMDFCFARRGVEQLLDRKFLGEWKYLRKLLFDMSEERAGKAAIELAIFMRLLDDRDDISSYLTAGSWQFGRVVTKGKPDKILRMRDVANKIIHASDLKWDLSNADDPILVCISQKKEKWDRAEVKVIALAAFCGGLMS